MRATRFVALFVASAAVGMIVLSGAQSAASAAESEADTVNRYVFVINRLDARPVALARMRDALAAFSRDALRPQDQVMIVEIGYSTKTLQEFTDSRETTLETIRNLIPLPIGLYQREATRVLYASLRDIAEVLEGLPGRKAVILASTEPNVIRRGVHYVSDTVEALNRANASVYSVDLDVFRRPFGRTVARSGLSGLALGTGGRYFFTAGRVGFLPSLMTIPQELDIDAVVGTES